MADVDPVELEPCIIGGIVGATIASAGSGAVDFNGVFSDVVIPAACVHCDMDVLPLARPSSGRSGRYMKELLRL